MHKKLLPAMAALGPLAHAVAALAATAENAAPEPQPKLLDINLTAIIWVLVLFCILLLILHKTAWRSVLDGLKVREERIRKDIADAEAARLNAEATLRQYSARSAEAQVQVRQILAQGMEDAERIAAGVKASAQKEAQQAKEHAALEIEAAKRQALGDIYAQTADLATLVAEKIIGRSLNADDQRELVRQSLEQIQKISHN